MNLLPYLRSRSARALVTGALMLAVGVFSARAQSTDDGTPTPPAGPAASEVVAPENPPAPPAPAPAAPVAEASAQVETSAAAPAVESTAPVEAPASRREHHDSERERIQQLVTIRGDAHLQADETTPEMVTIMGSAIVDGVVDGNCVTVMGNVTVNGKVRGDLVCVMGQITLGPGAEIRGQTVAVGGALTSDPSARIRGQKVVLTIPGIGGSFGGWLGEWLEDGLAKARILPHEHSWAWSAALVLVLLNVMFAVLFGGAVTASARAAETRPVFSVVNGALVLLLAPALLVLLAVSVVGIPLIPIAVAGLFLCWFIGTIGIFAFCGQQFGLRDRPVLAALVGNLAFLLLYALPVVGFAVWSVTAVMGLGAAFTALGNRRREAREARLAARRAQAAPAQPGTPAPSPVVVTPLVSVAPAQPAAAVAAAAPLAGQPPTMSAGFSGTGVETSTAPVAPAAPAASPAPEPSQTLGLFAPSAASPGWTPPPAPGPAPAPAPAPQAVPVSTPPLPVEATSERATFWPRLFAFLIDMLVVTVAINILGLGSFPTWVLAMIAYHVFFWGWRGTTPAGIVGNLQIVRDDGSPMDYKVAAVRALSGVFSLIPAGIGFIWVAFDRDSQSWHDKLAGTSVVAVRKAKPLI